MFSIYSVITNNGDGSNSIWWVHDPAVLAEMENMAETGHETFASGDGLQVKEFKFKNIEALDDFVELNNIELVLMYQLDDYKY